MLAERLVLLSLALLVPIGSSPATCKHEATRGDRLGHAEFFPTLLPVIACGTPGNWLSGPSDVYGCGADEEEARRAAQRDFEGQALSILRQAGGNTCATNCSTPGLCKPLLNYSVPDLLAKLNAGMSQTPSGYCTSADASDVKIRITCTDC